MKLDNDIVGCISPIEGSLLFQFSFRIDRDNSIANIGCYRGRSLQYILKGRRCRCKTIFPTLYAVDTKIRDDINEIMNTYSDISIIEGSSQDPIIINQIPNNLELLFIDGDHTYDGCMADLNNFWPKVISGGVMMVHDVFDTSGKQCEPEVNRAFFDFTKVHMGEFVPDNWYLGPIHRVDSSAVVWKKEE
jgi:cephalosporin hydroxylase